MVYRGSQKNLLTYRGYLMCKKGWHSIPHLVILLRPVALKEVIVGKGLQSGRLTYCQTPALLRVWVNEVVTIFGNVACDGRTGRFVVLDSESIRKLAALPICMCGREPLQCEFAVTFRRVPALLCKHCSV